MEAMVSQDADRTKLSHMLRFTQMAEKLDNEGWGASRISTLIANTKTLCTQASDVFMRGAIQTVKDLTDADRPWCCGGADGQKWSAGLEGSATWAALVERARGGLLKQDPKLYTNGIQALEEVRPLASG